MGSYPLVPLCTGFRAVGCLRASICALTSSTCCFVHISTHVHITQYLPANSRVSLQSQRYGIGDASAATALRTAHIHVLRTHTHTHAQKQKQNNSPYQTNNRI